jgi:hypothetical protein
MFPKFLACTEIRHDHRLAPSERCVGGDSICQSIIASMIPTRACLTAIQGIDGFSFPTYMGTYDPDHNPHALTAVRSMGA